MDFPRLIGIIGLILISFGVLQRRYKLRDHIFIAGSVFLFAYSIAIEDIIFAILQLIFIGSSLYDLNRSNRSSFRPGSGQAYTSQESGHRPNTSEVIPERSKR